MSKTSVHYKIFYENPRLTFLFGILLFTFYDVAIKEGSGNFPVSQLLIARSLVGSTLLLAFSYSSDEIKFISLLQPIVLLRAVLIAISSLSIYLGLSVLPLSVAVSCFFISPFALLLLAKVALGEPLSKQKWFSILGGCIGVLVVMNPKAFSANGYAVLLPIFGGVLYAVVSVLTRYLRNENSGLLLTLSAEFSFLVSGVLLALYLQFDLPINQLIDTPFITRHWQPLGLEALISLVVFGIISVCASYVITQCYRINPVSDIASLEYSSIPFAIVIGLFYFQEIPTVNEMVGSFLIIIFGVMANHK